MATPVPRPHAEREHGSVMGDSDEEHERNRSRDKFRRERHDYGDKPRNRGQYRDRRTWRDDHDNMVNLGL